MATATAFANDFLLDDPVAEEIKARRARYELQLNQLARRTARIVANAVNDGVTGELKGVSRDDVYADDGRMVEIVLSIVT